MASVPSNFKGIAVGVSKSPQRTVSVSEDTYQLLSRLRSNGAEEDEFVIRRSLLVMDVYSIVDHALHSTTDLRKCEYVARSLRTAGYSQEMSLAICRALFGGQSEKDMKKAFRFFDTDRSESINKSELVAALPLMGEKVSDEQIDDLFKLVDTDNTGYIDFKEFCVLVKGMNSRDAGSPFHVFRSGAQDVQEGLGAIGSAVGNVAESAGSTVSAIQAGWGVSIKGLGLNEARKAGIVLKNLEGAGYSQEEGHAMCRVVFGQPTDKQFRKAFRAFDSDGNNYLDAEEFKKALPYLGEQVPPEKVEELFRLVDQDGNGQVSLPEFVAICKAMNPKAEGSESGSGFSLGAAWGALSASWPRPSSDRAQ